MACTLTGFGLGALALVRSGLRHPLGWAIAIQLAFLSVMGSNPTGINFGATRMAVPVTILAILALVTPDASARVLPNAGDETVASNAAVEGRSAVAV